MTLEDKFRPNDGTLINEFDNYMLAQATKVGNFYQTTTGRNYKELTSIIHNIALATALSLAALTYQLDTGITLGYAFGARRNQEFTTPLQEEIAHEVSGNNKHKSRYARLIPLLGAACCLSVGLYRPESNEATNWATTTDFGCALAWSMVGFANYLSKTNLPPPKKKETTPLLLQNQIESNA